MEGRRLILNDETVIEDGRAGYSGGFLWLWLPGFTMQEAALIAFDPEKTASIVFQYGDMSDKFDGFTVCTCIMQQENQTAVSLIRGENDVES